MLLVLEVQCHLPDQAIPDHLIPIIVQVEIAVLTTEGLQVHHTTDLLAHPIIEVIYLPGQDLLMEHLQECPLQVEDQQIQEHLVRLAEAQVVAV